MLNRIYIVLILTLHCCVLTQAQNSFQRQISLADTSSYGLAVANLPDGRFAVGGYVERETQPGKWDAALWMFDAQGNLQWSKKYYAGSNEEELISDLIVANDGNLMATYIRTKTNFGTRSGVAKIDLNGNIIWANYLNDFESLNNHIIPTADGYAISGALLQGPLNAALILKVLEDGTSKWLRVIKADQSSAEQLAVDNQGNIYFSGQVNGDGMLAKISDTGSLLWVRGYGSGQSDFLSEMVRLPDGDILLAGSSSGFGNGYSEVFAVRTDAEGVIRWSKTYSIAAADIAPVGMQSLPDGSAIIALTETGSAANSGATLIRVDPTGNLTLQNSYGIMGKDARFSSLTLLNDTGTQGVLATGYQQDGNGISLLVVKTDGSNQDYRVAVCCPKTVALEVKDIIVSVTPITVATNFGGQLSSESLTKINFSPGNDNLCPMPNSLFTLSDTAFCPGECLTVAFPEPTQGVTYSWTFQGAEPESSTLTTPPKICYSSAGTFNVVLNANGCALLTKPVIVGGELNAMPNAFTPDNDGINDTFKPVIKCPIEEYSLQVFNRWGALVFESLSLNQPWDGTVNGEPAPVDVYIYRVEYYSIVNGERVLIKNDMQQVTLIR